MADSKRKTRDLPRKKLQSDTGLIIRRSTGYLICDSSICGGCKKCEIVCSLYHEGLISPTLARITVKRDIFDSYIFEAMPCLQCNTPECLFVCPVEGAFYVDDVTGARVIDEGKCIGCKLCMKACPTTPKGVRYNAEKKICFKCDLCGGEPQCVKFCPTGALTLKKGKETNQNVRVIWMGGKNTQG